MPKTRNAFAFLSFNGERILQRRFFEQFREDFHFADTASDEEILAALTMNYTDDVDILQMKLDALDSLINRTTEYQEHIKRHNERLTKYAITVANKIASDETANLEILRARHKRAGELLKKYCGCIASMNFSTTFSAGGVKVDGTSGLCVKILKKYKEVDGELKRLYRKTFADRLKYARQSQGMTQAKLGKTLKLSRRAISTYENATREPSISLLLKLSKTLNRNVGWLLGAEPW